MRKNRVIAILILVIAAFAGCGKGAPSAQDDLDRKLEAMMNDVTLVGRSTRLNDDKTIGEEKYVIEKISKLTGETWLFQARIR